MKQIPLFNLKSSKTFGGSELVDKRKSRRPLSTKHATHLVLHSAEVLRHGSFLRHRRLIDSALARAKKEWGIKVYRVGVARDHIHLVIKIPCRAAYRFFIQFITGFLALKINPSPTRAKFWSYRPFTRVVEWGKAFVRACKYVEMNEHEAQELIKYQPRGRGSIKKREKMWNSYAEKLEVMFEL